MPKKKSIGKTNAKGELQLGAWFPEKWVNDTWDYLDEKNNSIDSIDKLSMKKFIYTAINEFKENHPVK
jgi:hypothetical protein